MSNLFSKHWRLISIVIIAAIVLWVLYLLRMAILPFIIGLVLAYLLLPIVTWAEKKLPKREKWLETKRAVVILIIFIILIGLFGFLAYYITTVIIDASMVLLENAPLLISNSTASVQQWLENFRLQLPPEVSAELDKAILNIGTTIGDNIQLALIKGVSSIPSTFSVILGFAALPFFLFYILKDSKKLTLSFYSAFSPGIAKHIKNIVSIIERVLGRYIRAQIMLGIIVAYFSFIGLLILGVQYAPVLAVVAGITELIPTLGPWIGGAVAVIVTLAITPDKAIWVAVLYAGVQMLENYFLVPRIQSAYLKIHPAVMIFLIVFGAYIAGFWGLLLIAPLTATIVELYKYTRKQYRLGNTGEMLE